MTFQLNENPDGVELTRSESRERPATPVAHGAPCAVCGRTAHRGWSHTDEKPVLTFKIGAEDVALCAEHQRFTEVRLCELLGKVRAASSPVDRAKICEAHRGPMATHRRH